MPLSQFVGSDVHTVKRQKAKTIRYEFDSGAAFMETLRILTAPTETAASILETNGEFNRLLGRNQTLRDVFTIVHLPETTAEYLRRVLTAMALSVKVCEHGEICLDEELLTEYLNKL